MKPVTSILHLKVDESAANPAVTPLYQCSAFTADSPFFYSRKSNPNVVEFEEVIRTLEGATYSIAFATGMSAIYMVLDLLQPGDTLVVNRDIYGCSYRLFQRIALQRNLNLSILDLSIDSGIQAIPAETSMIVFETPTNPFLKTITIKKVSEKVKSLNPNALIVVDNTWATSLYQKPLNFGADISLHSCTKYFSGHSDVMGGIALVNDKELYGKLLDNRFYSGTILPPYNAWLLRRSMQTFELRMRHHHTVTVEMSQFLRQFPEVKRLYYPYVDGEQLQNYGGIIFFEFRDDLIEQYKIFSKSLKLFSTGTGMACVTSMVAQPYSGSHASMTDTEKASVGIGKGLVRLCFGLEDIEDLKKDLINAFNTINKKSFSLT